MIVSCLNGCIADILIDSLLSKAGVHTTRPVNLRAFASLKRLCIRTDFLLESRLFYDMKDLTFPKLFQVLPPSLEQLHLEIGDEQFSMHEDGFGSPVHEDVYWMLDTLEELAIRKAEYLPHLWRVVCGEAVNFDYDYRFWNIINDCERGARLKAVFSQRSIQFSSWTSDEDSRDFKE